MLNKRAGQANAMMTCTDALLLCGQNSKRCKGCGAACRAADEPHLNTDAVLVDKARMLAPILCKSVHRESELLLQRLRKQDKCVVHAQLWPVFLELTFFLVHYVRKSIFLDRLSLELAEFLASAYADEDAAQRFCKLLLIGVPRGRTSMANTRSCCRVRRFAERVYSGNSRVR